MSYKIRFDLDDDLERLVTLKAFDQGELMVDVDNE
jgi:hypothetical protein